MATELDILTVTSYRAPDGKTFNTRAEAETYWIKAVLVTLLESWNTDRETSEDRAALILTKLDVNLKSID